MGGPIDQGLLRQVSHNLLRLSQELFVVKRQLGLGDETGSQSSGTVARCADYNSFRTPSVDSLVSRYRCFSELLPPPLFTFRKGFPRNHADEIDWLGAVVSCSDASAMSDVMEMLEWKELSEGVGEKVRAFSDNIHEQSGVRRSSARAPERPSTAQRALDVTETVQAEMKALTDQMQVMMAEIQALRASGAASSRRSRDTMFSVREEEEEEEEDLVDTSRREERPGPQGESTPPTPPLAAAVNSHAKPVDEFDQLMDEIAGAETTPLLGDADPLSDDILALMEEMDAMGGSSNTDSDEDECDKQSSETPA